jgi:integrase
MTEEEKQRNPRKERKHRRRVYGTGSIFQRKNRRGKQWVVQITLDNGKIIQRYCKTQEEAGNVLNELLYEQRHGTLITEKDQTVKQYFERWLEIHKTKIRWSTYLRYQTLVKKHILPALGRLSLHKLTAHDLESLYARKLEEGLSPISVEAIHKTIHLALKQAVRWRLINRNVSEDISPPRETHLHERQVLTPEQAQQLLAAAKGHRLEAMITLALTTGMRRGELLALRWRDIDFGQNCLYIRRSASRLPGGYQVTEPKTARGKRKNILPHFVMEALQQHRIRQKELKLKAGPYWEENDLVFCNIYGRFLNTQSLFVLFSSLLKKAGLPHMRFHDLRHSAATILGAMGISAKVIQELLGHSSITITLNVYSHVLPSMQQEAMDKLDSLFGGAKQHDEDSEQAK